MSSTRLKSALLSLAQSHVQLFNTQINSLSVTVHLYCRIFLINESTRKRDLLNRVNQSQALHLSPSLPQSPPLVIYKTLLSVKML